MPPFVVGGRFNGTLEKLGVDASLTQPFAAHVRGNVLTPMRELGMDLAAQVSGFNAKAINPEWPVAQIRQGNLTIKGQLDDFTSEGRILGAYENYGAGQADYRLARKGDDLIFEYLNLKTEKGAAIAARGKVTLPTPQSELAMDVTADARGIDVQALNPEWPLVRIRQANVAIQGKLTDFTSRGQVSGSYENLATGVIDYQRGPQRGRLHLRHREAQDASGSHPERQRPGQPGQGRAPRRDGRIGTVSPGRFRGARRWWSARPARGT